MSAERFSVRRGAIRPFLVALTGVPLIALLYDFLTGSKVLTRFGELIYRDELDAFEPRDLIWAAVFGIAGTVALVWGLRELLFPRRVLVVDDHGLSVAMGGPFRSAVRVPWDNIDALRIGELEIDEEVVPRLELTVLDRGLLPDRPWGARWRDDYTISLDVAGWDKSPAEVFAAFDSRRRAALVRGLESSQD